MFGWIEWLSGVGALRAQLAALDRRLTERADAVSGPAERTAAAVDRLGGRLDDIDRRLDDVRGRCEDMAARIGALDARSAALDDRMSYDHGNLSLRIDAVVAHGERLQDQAGRSDEDQRAAGDRLRDLADVLHRTEAQLSATDQTVDRLRTELLRLQHRFDLHAADAGKTAVALLERIELARTARR